MTAKLLSEKAVSVINQYKNFSTGIAVCSVPYFNNKHLQLRGALKAQAGKGSPQDILIEAKNEAALEKIKLEALDTVSLKKFLVEKNLGIDCSGLAYYVLDAESESREKAQMKKNLAFPFAKSLFRKFRAKTQPEKNTDVATLASDKNSRVVELRFIEPGDMITMLGGPDQNDRDHVLIVHEVDYKDENVVSISYTHAVAWPTDGEYGHGVRQGVIRVTDPSKPITEQEWIENGQNDGSNYTLTRAQKSKTEIRRLNWL